MTIYYLTEPSTNEEILSLLTEEIREWFIEKFPNGFTPPQLFAIPSIHNRQNTLIFSSTGSGKTFAAFLAAINELFLTAKRGELKDQVYVLYVSPLKALGNDIRKNLEEPLCGIQELAAKRGYEIPPIRVQVRTGDTPQSERAKMSKKPPHILITTPESLGLILTSPKFSQKLNAVRWIIVDEIHEVSNNKRGALLSLFLEYLQCELIENDVTRIGLSATQAPIEEIARFLVGKEKDGTERDCYIANLPPQRRYDLRVVSPVKDLLHTPYVLVQESIYSLLARSILEHETSIIFTNTRKGAESVGFKLKTLLGEEYANLIGVHHSSLSRETRLNVEDRLKNNELLAVVSSTSLELGIDIGSVELVAQIGSPKSVAKYLQRVGRSGHSVFQTAKGRLIVTDRDDAIECTVLTKSAYAREIDKVQIPKNCLDVLAQFIVGISLIKRWSVDEAYQLVRCSYNFAYLPREDYINVLEYLGGYKLDIEERKVYRKIWYDKDEQAFGKKRNARLIFYTNIGTIPESADYTVELETYRTRLGKLSESFVERLKPGDIFVLGSYTYQFKRTVGSRVIVSEALGRRPTVPSWVGEMLPRSFELSQQVGKFIDVVSKKIKEAKSDKELEKISEWLTHSFRCDENIARTIIDYIKEQLLFLTEVPSDKRLLVESFIDPQGRQNIVFHAYYGRRVNDALSRAYAYAIGKKLSVDVAAAVNDNGFLLVLPVGSLLEPTEVPSLVTSKNLEQLLKKAIINTELFRTRFRHVANRALMILRHNGNRTVPVSRQTLYTRRILPIIRDQDDFCVIKETYREVLKDYMDYTNAEYVLKKLESGNYSFSIMPISDIPSPFAHGIVLLGISDVVQIADRSALLRELHKQVLEKVFGKGQIQETLFPKELVKGIFSTRSYRNPNVPISSFYELKKAIKTLAPIRTLDSLSPSIYSLSMSDVHVVRSWVLKMHEEKEVIEIAVAPNDVRTVATTEFPLFWNIYVEEFKSTETTQKILKALKRGPRAITELEKELELSQDVIKIHLSKLERSFKVLRTDFVFEKGKMKWKYGIATDVVPQYLFTQARLLDPEECLQFILIRHLHTQGPSTIEELMEYLRIDKEKILRALRELEEKNIVLQGKITHGDIHSNQYILLEDRELLRQLANREKDSLALSNDELQYVRFYYVLGSYWQKSLKGRESVFSILEDLGTVENLNSIIIRGVNIDQDMLNDLLQKGEILQARLSKSRVAYVLRKVFPYYYVAYKSRFNISSTEQAILSCIKKYGPLSKKEISEVLQLDGEIVNESINVLDYGLYLVRRPSNVNTFSQVPFTTNVYDISERYLPEKLPSLEESQKFVISKIISSLGPISIVELTQISGFEYNIIEYTIKTLIQEGRIVEKKIANRDVNYYLTRERYEEIKRLRVMIAREHLTEEDTMAILPRSDPLTKLGLRKHLRDIYGEGFIDPILYNGKLIGSIEYKVYLGRYLQVYDLKIESHYIYDHVLLRQIALELVKYARTVHRIFSVQIEDINGSSVLSKKNSVIREIFQSVGYRLVSGTLLGGESISMVFPKEVLLKYLLEKFWIFDEYPALNSSTLVRLIEDFGYITLEEIVARFPHTEKNIIIYLLNQLLIEKKIVYADKKFLSYKFAYFRRGGIRKRKKQTPEIKQIYNLINKGYQTIEQITEKSNLSKAVIRKAITALEKNVSISAKKIDLDGTPIAYQVLKKAAELNDEEREKLEKEYIYYVINSLGLATEDQIVQRAYIPSVVTKVKIRAIIGKLLDEKLVLSGRFLENSLNFYFISKENYKRLTEQNRRTTEDTMMSKKQNVSYLVPPTDVLLYLLQPMLPEHFDKASLNYYLVVINQTFAAQFKYELSKKEVIISNLILAPNIETKEYYQRVINGIEAITNFAKDIPEKIKIKQINGISITKLVKK